MRKNFYFIAMLILSLSVNALASGCGKKGPPMPPDEEKSLTTVEPTAEPGTAPETPAAPESEDAQEPGTPPSEQP